jgi:hypothetical protein
MEKNAMGAQFNQFELENFSKITAQAYLDGGVDLNDTITKLAQENDFTPHHIERVVQGANILVNGALVGQAREQHQDPRVTFPLANTGAVSERLNEPTARKHADYRARAISELYTMPAPAAVNRQQLLDGVLGKMAAAPYASRSVDHMALAASFMRKEAQVDVDAASLSLACQTLADLEHRALTDHNLSKLAMEQAERELRDELHDQMLAGLSPATARDVIKHAHLSPLSAQYVDTLVTKVAARLRLREGESAFTTTALVNREHPLIIKSASVDELVAMAARSHRGLEKIADANHRAHAQYAKTLHEARG